MGLFDSIGSVLGFPGQSSMNAGYASATDAINKSLPKATEQIDKYYGLASSGLSPYTSFGTSVLPSLQNLITNPSSITSQPGYQFQMSEGLRGVMQSNSSLGKFFSGQNARGLENYAAGQAGTSYLGQLSTLGGLAGGIGQGSATSLAQMGMGAGSTLASGILGAGQNLAQLYASQGVNTANASSSMFGNLAQLGGAYMMSPYSLFG